MPEKINYKDLFFETQEALVVLLMFYEGLTCEKATPSFISDRQKLVELAKNYDLKFAYSIYEKIKNVKMHK